MLCPFFTPSRVLMQHLSSAVKTKCQCGKHKKTYMAASAGFTNASHRGFLPLQFTSAAFIVCMFISDKQPICICVTQYN